MAADPQPAPDPTPPVEPTPEPTPSGDLRTQLESAEGKAIVDGIVADRVHKLNDENASRRRENVDMRKELDSLREQVTSGKLDGKEKRERETRILAAKDRALKDAEAARTLERVTLDTIREAEAGGKVEVDTEKVAGLINEVVAGTVNPDLDVEINVGGDGKLDVFVKSATVDRLKSAVGRVVELASTEKAEPTPPGPPGPTLPRPRGKSALENFERPVPGWARERSTGELQKGKQKIADAAAAAGASGDLGRMDTAL